MPFPIETIDQNEEVAEERLKLTTVPFIACGSVEGFDSETTMVYDKFIDPIQPPITAPYLQAIAAKRGQSAASQPSA